MKVLLVPAEVYPCHESFLEEVFTRGDLARRCTFLMRAAADGTPERTTWNDADVITLPATIRRRWVRNLRVYFTDLRYVPAFWRAVRALRPDLVLVRDMTFPLLLAMILRPFLGFAVVFQKTYPNELRWFDPAWVHAHRYPWLWVLCRRVEDWTLHVLMKYADATVPITHYMAEDLHRRWGHDLEKSFPFGMGIDPGEPAAPRTQSSDHDPVRFVYVGTLASSRRLEVMIESFARVAQSAQRELHLTVLGGDEQQVAFLRDRARAFGVEDRVDLRGLVPRAQVYPIVREHDASLAYIPCDPRFHVASPAKVIECLALGIPVVATPAVAVNHDLAEMTEAVVIGSDTVEGYAAAIEQLVADLPRLRANAQAHRQRVIEEYDYRKMRERVWAILERIVEERAAQGIGKSASASRGRPS